MTEQPHKPLSLSMMLTKAIRKNSFVVGFTTHGSGFDTTGFSRKPKQYEKKMQIGYLSRFGKSKEVTKF